MIHIKILLMDARIYESTNKQGYKGTIKQGYKGTVKQGCLDTLIP